MSPLQWGGLHATVALPGTPAMTTETNHLYVALSASQVRRRLQGYGFGVKRVESAGKGRALIVHTATGGHLAAPKALFRKSDVAAQVWDR